MAALNPIQLVNLLRQGNPQSVAQQIIQANYSNDPIMQNLFQMGQKGDIQGLKQFAQQYFSQQGKDFNKEMENFMSMIKAIQ